MAQPCATDAVGCTEEPALDRSRRPGWLVQRRQIGNMGSALKRLRKRRSCSETFCVSARIIARHSAHQDGDPCRQPNASVVLRSNAGAVARRQLTSGQEIFPSFTVLMNGLWPPHST